MSLEPLPTSQIRVITFDPGDGTVYRAVFAPLDAPLRAATYVGASGMLFAFGVGNRPFTGYFFNTHYALDFGYFTEKMHGCSEGYPTTICMAWLTLLVLLGRDMPVQLPSYSDNDELLQRWYESLDEHWADTVRQLAHVA